MTTRRTKKHKKFRGHRTYHGSHKKWRGGGNRGGRGNAGGHKHKWSFVVKYDQTRFGKKGFKPQYELESMKRMKTINLSELDKMLDKLLEKKLAEMDGKAVKIDLMKIGYKKLLGSGKVTKPLIVQAKSFSKSAAKKLEESGGKAVLA